MSSQAECKAALAKADANWRRASDELDQAHAARVKANVVWDNLVVAQHGEEVDRRAADTAAGTLISDLRSPDSERRKARTDFVAFSKIVAVRHEAYLAQISAEAIWVQAAADLVTAIAAQKIAAVALDDLKRAGAKA